MITLIQRCATFQNKRSKTSPCQNQRRKNAGRPKADYNRAARLLRCIRFQQVRKLYGAVKPNTLIPAACSNGCFIQSVSSQINGVNQANPSAARIDGTPKNIRICRIRSGYAADFCSCLDGICFAGFKRQRNAGYEQAQIGFLFSMIQTNKARHRQALSMLFQDVCAVCVTLTVTLYALSTKEALTDCLNVTLTGTTCKPSAWISRS